MIRIFLKTFLYRLFRRFGWPKVKPVNFTLGISCVCNSRCQTCHIWEKKVEELKIEEWEKILKKIGSGIFWVTISGGEPFLASHLVALVKLVKIYLQPNIITIPTNGLLTEVIIDKVKRICEENNKVKIIINFSLDGLGPRQDEIRGVEGSFEKLIKTYRGVKQLDYDNLTVGIHTVISKLNTKDLPTLFNFVLDELKPDQYITEIAERRVELDNLTYDITPSPEEYSLIIDSLREKIKKHEFKKVGRITEAFRLEYYQAVKRILREETQVIPCYAGVASAQISADGQIWPCCIRADNLGNLRDNNYDFKKVWFSPEAGKVRRSIKNKECACPLANAFYTNMLGHNRTLLKVITHLR
ncbi:MAG: radical SAM protein [Patescibacteria group bacterium]